MNKVRLYHRLSRNYLLAWCLLFLGFGVTAVVGWSLFQQSHKLDQIRFDRLVQQTTEALRDRLEKYELALSSLADVAASRPSLTPAEWNFHVRFLGPEKNYPGLLELGVAETGARRRARQAHDPESVALDLSLTESNALRLLHAWVRPPSAYDGINPRFFTDKAIEEAAALAVRSGSPAYCYRRELSSEIAGNPAQGFTIILPLFEPGPGEALTNQAAGAGPDVVQEMVLLPESGSCALARRHPAGSFFVADTLTSPATNSAWPPPARISPTRLAPRSGSRPLASTEAPSRAKRSAVARPIPLVAPVTMATLPCSLLMRAPHET
jgi:hypothetical protein